MFNGLRPILLAGLLALLIGGNPQPTRAQEKVRQSLELKLGVADSLRPRQPVHSPRHARRPVASPT